MLNHLKKQKRRSGCDRFATESEIRWEGSGWLRSRRRAGADFSTAGVLMWGISGRPGSEPEGATYDARRARSDREQAPGQLSLDFNEPLARMPHHESVVGFSDAIEVAVSRLA